jgi:Sulfotransferase family
VTAGTRPPPVVLDDLADPRFPDDVAPILDAMAAAAEGLELTPAALMAAASDATGLDDFGDLGFVGRLDVLCTALREEAGLSPAGLVSLHTQLVSLLRNRLLVQDLLTTHPEILDVRIERPLVIAGLPRTGTTHLHNLLAADPALRSLPYWESLEPVLPEAERAAVAAGAPDPRLERCQLGLDVVNGAMPHFRRMHDMTVEHVHEEIQLLAMDVSTMLFETLALVPSWRDAYLATNQAPSYAYLKTVLQALQWLRGGTRWVLKSPQHIEQFGPLMEVFPDATVVVTHRDPVAVTTSVVTMLTYAARLQAAEVDPLAIGHYWADRVETMLRACADDRDLLPARQSLDVHFTDFMADDVAMVQRIYGVAGQPFTAEVEQAMRAFMEEHPRGRHGGVRYDLTTFGLDPAELRDRFAFYVARFGVAPERT